MSTLHTLQHAFQDALLCNQPTPAGLLGLGRCRVAQFDVYRHAYRARLRGALRDNYEVLPLVMGDAAFDALAHAYMDAHPSQHYSLRWFGHALSAFMATHDALVDHPAMVDLARMEWALRHAFDAAAAPLLTAAELRAVPAPNWAQWVFTLHPSVQLLDLQWAVGPVWHALKSGADDVPAPHALNHAMLVWRRGMAAQWKTLSPSEAIFVQSLLTQKSFGAVCVDLAEHVGHGTAAATAVRLLTDLLHHGILCQHAAPAVAPSST